MTRWTLHAGAAARRVWRQQARTRRTWLAIPAAGALSAASAGDAAPWPELGAAVTFGFAFAIAITTIGAPGDDLASGALAHDLLAGTPPSALAVGTTLGCIHAALPAGAAALATALASAGGGAEWPRTGTPWPTILQGVGAMLVGGAALAATFVWLGTVLTGRAAAAVTWPLTFAGFIPGHGLPLAHLPPPLADAIRVAWDSLPLPHHVVATLRSAVGTPVELGPHLWPLLGAVVSAPLAAAAVLRLRVARGRWT